MGSYVLKRLGQTLIVLFIASIGVFFLMDLLPGDPVYAMLGDEATQEQHDMLWHELGYDKPVVERYFTWLGNFVKGDFGTSVNYRRSVTEIIGPRVAVTIYFSVISFLISVPIGIFLGVIAAVHRGQWKDTVVTLIANICACLPQFWVAILCLYIFVMQLHWFPARGFTWFFEDFGLSFRQSVLPLFCLVVGSVAGLARQTRSSMLEVIRQDYVVTARSKGLKERKIIYIHALKNGLIPVISNLGMRLAHLVGGSMFVESVFSIPGMGSLFVLAIGAKDIPLIQACVLLTALVSCVAYIITDIAYAAADPRIQFTKGA